MKLSRWIISMLICAPGNPCGVREPRVNSRPQQRRVTLHMPECQQVAVRVSGCLGTLSTA
jgi:hypothetical protein